MSGLHAIGIGEKRRRTLNLALLVITAIVNFFPIYWLIITPLKPASHILSRDLGSLFPRILTLSNYLEILHTEKFLRYLLNSTLVATTATLITILVSTLGGYSLARLNFPGRRLLGRLILFTYIVPSVLLVVPMFSLFVNFGLQNSYLGLVLAHITLGIPFSIWMLRGFFMSLPEELEEAAMIDGATRVGALFRIILPLSAPGIVAAAMFTFILSWNEYLFALVFINDDAIRTLPVGIAATFMSVNMQGIQWARLMSASVFSSIPVFLIFLWLQKMLVQGLSAGAVKG